MKDTMWLMWIMQQFSKVHSMKDPIRLMWIGQQFGRDALCEGHYVAYVDQATVWQRCTLRVIACG